MERCVTMPYFVDINTSVTKQMKGANERLGYNTMSFSTPDSVSLGAHLGSRFFKNIF